MRRGIKSRFGGRVPLAMTKVPLYSSVASILIAKKSERLSRVNLVLILYFIILLPSGPGLHNSVFLTLLRLVDAGVVGRLMNKHVLRLGFYDNYQNDDHVPVAYLNSFRWQSRRAGRGLQLQVQPGLASGSV